MSINIVLIDDDTPDAVVECCCSVCGEIWEERFNSSVIYRTSEGNITKKTWSWIKDRIEGLHDIHGGKNANCYIIDR